MKLFLVTRADLPPGQQAVQAAHALREFTERCPEEDRAWYHASNTLALLVVEDEKHLRTLVQNAEKRGLPHARFHEPDRGGELTAAAIGPSGKKLVSRLSLALR